MTRKSWKLCLSLILVIFIQLVDLKSLDGVPLCDLNRCEGYKNFSSCTCLHIEIVDCHLCPQSERIEEYENDKCLCSENGLKKQQLFKDLCYRYHQGLFKCPVSSDPQYAIYFDESTCQCKNVSATPCGEIIAPCLPPYSWHQGDNHTLCLCTALFKCSLCPPVTIIKDFGNDTCMCRDINDNEEFEFIYKVAANKTQSSKSVEIAAKKYSDQTDYCYLYSKKLFSCPKFHNPLVISKFNTYTCSCEILIADPCSDSVAPCVAPNYWYEGDNKINCACVTQRLCSHCDPELIVEQVEENECICQRPKSDEMITVPNKHPVNEKCDLYRNGSYFCPIFDSMLVASYFNETTCECETITADVCSLKDPTCDEPYHWYNDDTSLLCLCVHKIDCEDCLDDRIVEVSTILLTGGQNK